MPKDYNSFSDVATGDVYSAASHNLILENINNYRVPPSCLLTISSLAISAQVDLGNTTTSGTWTEQVDTDTMHDAVTNPTRITVNTAGIYLVTASLLGNASNINAFAMVKVNGTQTAQTTLGNTSYFTRGQATLIHSAAVNDYYEFATAASSSITCDFRFSAVWLGQVS